jgi:dolichol-phosphate mannosyltransferase
MESLAVVIPVYDEEQGIAETVAAVLEVLDGLERETLMIAVEDGSSDGSRQVFEDLARRHERLHVEVHAENHGYGAALRTGAESADRLGLSWVLFMDSDLTNPPEEIPRFAALIDGPVDYVKASRFVPGGSMVGIPAGRRVFSAAANRVARLAAGRSVTDPTNGFRAIRTKAFLEMPLAERDFAIIMEELVWARRLGLRCADVPSTLTTRDEHRRSTSFGYTPSLLRRYLRYTLALAAARFSGSRERRVPVHGRR